MALNASFMNRPALFHRRKQRTKVMRSCGYFFELYSTFLLYTIIYVRIEISQEFQSIIVYLTSPCSLNLSNKFYI